MGVVDWMKHHWKGGAIFVLATITAAIITKAVDQHFDFGWFAAAPSWVANICTQLIGWLAFQVSLPIWLMLLILTPAALLMRRLHGERCQLSQSLAAATEELERLKQPPPPTAPRLNADQRRVLQAIADVIEKRRGFPCFADLVRETGFTHLVTEGATDILETIGFIQWQWDGAGIKRATLTPDSRAYLLSPEISSEYWNQSRG